MNNSAKKIAYIGVMSSLEFAVLALETYVFVLFIKPSPAILTIPIAIAICLRGEKWDMLVGGTIFGVCSFILSFMVGLVSFSNPLISILPRVIMGIAVYYSCRLFEKHFSGSKNTFVNSVLPVALAGAVGVIVNTVLVLSMLMLFDFSGIKEVLAAVLSFNTLFELISGIILTPVLVKTIKKTRV